MEYTAYSILVFTKLVREPDQTNSISIVMCRISVTVLRRQPCYDIGSGDRSKPVAGSLVETEDSTSVLIVHPNVCALYAAMSSVDLGLEDKAHCPSKAQLRNEDTRFRHRARRPNVGRYIMISSSHCDPRPIAESPPPRCGVSLK